MFRKHLIKLLLENPMSLRQIARMEEELPDRIADDLNHLYADSNIPSTRL